MKKQAILLPFLAMTLVGCSGGSSSGIKITIWEDQSNHEMVKKITDDFVSEYRQTYPKTPKITIEIIDQKEKSAVEEMSRGIAESGNGPDIAAITHDTITTGVTSNIISKASFGEELKARMTEEAINAVTVDGEIYGYPITAESTTIMYNSDLVSASELESFDALKASGKKLSWALTGDDGGYYTWGLYTDSVLFGADGKDAKTVDIDTPKTTQNVYDFFHNYGSCFVNESPEDAISSIEAQRTVGVVTSPFMLSQLKNASFGSKIKLAKLPKINGESLRPFSGYKAYVVSRHSPNAALAHELCNYMTSYDYNAYRLKTAGYLPATRLDGSEDIQELIIRSAEAQVFAASLEDSMVMPNIQQMGNFWRPINNASTYFEEHENSLTLNDVKTKLAEVESTLLG